MPWLIHTTFIWVLVFILVRKRFYMLWGKGLLGVAIMVLVDCIGIKINLYHYAKGLFYIGCLPLLHIISIYGASILYLNWLPQQTGKRILYTIYFSALFLSLEAAMYSAGAVIYPNWKISYSYFLNIGGLLALAYLADLFKKIKLEP